MNLRMNLAMNKASYNSSDLNGILLLHKPVGITSNHIIQKIKRILQIKKIGHAGTLDKFAQGLLIVLLGKATKLSDIFLNYSKVYESDIHFGKETDTGDVDGTCINNAPIPSEETILKSLEYYKGTMEQSPPIYSAIHVNGRRASQLVRAGVPVTLPPRTITIYQQELLKLSLPIVRVRWHVSKGTYIRSLARDLGKTCNSCAFLSSLIRVCIGNFSLENAVLIEDLDAESKEYIQNRKGFFTIDELVPYIDNNEIHHTDKSDIRSTLAKGIQPTQILDSLIPTTKQYCTLYDEIGVLGIWKKNQSHWKQVLAC